MHLDADRNKRWLLLVAGALCAVLLLVGCVVLALGVGDSPEPSPQSGTSVPEDKLLVNDLYDGTVLIPKFELEKSEVDLDKLTEKNGLRSYQAVHSGVGVDVSEFQGDIDWQQVKDSGIEFAMLRIGYRGTTQGMLFADECFEKNYEGARAAGLDVGVYFFSQATTEEEAREEASFVLDLLGDRKLQYPVAFDWELPVSKDSAYRVNSVSGAEAAQYGMIFCEEILAMGYRPMVYTNKYCAYQFFDLNAWKNYDLWYAEYQEQPSLYYEYRMWQYTESGTVPGISVPVDLNICMKTY